MNFQKIVVPIAGVILVAASYRAYGWGGVAVVTGGIVMWVLLNFTRMVTVLKRAGDRPIGHVASAVMFNAKLKPGMTLLHVVAMTRSLGALQSRKDEQPEVYRWTDAGESRVTVEFMNGKVVKWEMFRPVQTGEPAETPGAPTPPAP